LPQDPARPTVDVVDLAGDSLYAERVRELRTNLRFAVPAGSGGPAHSIAVVSPTGGEGRTTTAIDLAAALAESGRSVILVDGDLRSPELADLLPLDDHRRSRALHQGVSTVLVGEHALAEAVIGEIPVGAHSIALLPAGPKAPRPGELWANDRAQQLFEDLGSNFDYVVVDTPPLDSYADGANVSALCDGALLLARIDATTSSALRRALQSLQTASVTLIGTVATFDHVSLGTMRNHRKQVKRDAQGGGEASAAARDQTAAAGRTASTEKIPVQRGELVGTGNPPRPRSRHGSS
jgi:receptor protein-tyrosine kinase